LIKVKSGWTTCPICQAKLKAEKLDGHLKNVHPKGVKTQEARAKIVGRRTKVKGATKGLAMVALVVLVVIIIVFAYTHIDIRGTKVGNKPYNFTLQSTDGTKYTLDDFLGDKPILLGMMSTECLHCMDECDVFHNINVNYSDQVEIVILFSNEYLDSGEPTQMSDVKNRAETHDLQFPVLFDRGSKNYHKYTSDLVEGYYPLLFVINKNGKIDWTNKYTDPYVGFHSYQELTAKLDKDLA
jgi:peroxiredoxin